MPAARRARSPPARTLCQCWRGRVLVAVRIRRWSGAGARPQAPPRARPRAPSSPDREARAKFGL
eukprot:4150170-Prymnesium_polylepis.1